jgi:hypothetical protein
MMAFADFFSDEAIIRELCVARVKLATRRHEAAFLHNISTAAKAPDQVSPKGWGTIREDIFPSRKLWHSFRRRFRGTAAAEDVNLGALLKGVLTLRVKTPRAPWVQRLNRTVQAIQKRVFSPEPFRFSPPSIIAVPKKPGSHEYRALAAFPLAEKIIEGLTARYFRQLLDHALLPSCLAFRCGRGSAGPPSTHSALDILLETRARHEESGLFVAECDIRGFYDCVPHRVARAALRELIKDARITDKMLRVDPRAKAIFNAFLRSYSFGRLVRNEASRLELRKRDPDGTFPWPEDELRRLHPRGRLAQIGVPQGGALSCFIANAVLHAADKALAELQVKTGAPFTYLRYVDDMILLAPRRQVCSAAFDEYRRVLATLQLPAHPAKLLLKYGPQFFEGKSNLPYHWRKPQKPNHVKWIQFVGYQIRYDGLVRIRPRSLKKHMDAISGAANRLLGELRRAQRKTRNDGHRRLRRTAREIQHRFCQKLISIGVGRVAPGRPKRGPMPMCWAAGFRGLAGKKILRYHLKRLDMHRERQLKRVQRELATIPLPETRPHKPQIKARKYYGRPYSYWQQF